MTTPKDSNIRGILEKIGEITEQAADDAYIFRGESEEHEKVSSTLYRQYEDEIEAGHVDIEAMQIAMLRDAKQHTDETNDIEILTQLQHYGGKTNLIDFTTDIHIALFFACNGSSKVDGRVILERARRTRHEVARNPRNRIISQKSVFVRPPKGFIEPELDKIILVPRELKQIMLGYLQKNHGISTATIYNDLHGFIIDQPNHETAYMEFFKGRTCQEKGNHREAIRHYTKSIESKPNFTVAYYNRSLVYLHEEEYDRTIEDCDKVISWNPDFAEAYCQRGAAYWYKGDYDQAIADCDKAIDLKSNFALAYNNRGAAYEVKGRLDQAFSDYSKAIELDSDLADAHYNRGIARLQWREWDKAGIDLRNAKSRGKDVTIAFHREHKTIKDFERQHGVNLPENIKAILAPPQGASG